MTDLRNQQTLFRLISLREPELSKEQDQELRFVLFTANSGPFYTAVVNRPSNQTKWEALELAAAGFVAFTDVADLKALDEDFYSVADWISRNRYDANDSEIAAQVDGLSALDAAGELKLWNNLFYQVATQTSYYVKEVVCQYLVLQNLLKAQKGPSYMRILANARVVLPPFLFVEDSRVRPLKAKVKQSAGLQW